MQESWFRAGRARPQANEVMVEGIYAVAQALVSGPPPRSLQAMLDVLSTFLELRASSLAVFREDGTTDIVLDSRAQRSPHPALASLARATARRVGATHTPDVVESVWAELFDLDDVASSWLDTDLDASVVGVPVRESGKIIGSLSIMREHSAGDQTAFRFDADVRILGSVANLVSVALRVGRLTSDGTDRDTAIGATEESPSSSGSEGVLGNAECWRATLRTARVAARTNATVLLRGETGTGKNLVAGVVHEASPRRERPFVVLNCAMLSESVLESELFGHEKGSFTGAAGQRRGRFELANGGTLFLDEIGEVSGAFQAKLLRVLQEGEFERVGGSTTLKVDVRIIAATHRDLEAAVGAGTFRADLYYRLCVVPIRVPALRERTEDIPVLARAFLARFNAENGTALAFDTAALEALGAHSFPGNVRELENAVRRAASLSYGRTLTAQDFAFLRPFSAEPEDAPPPAPVNEAALADEPPEINPRDATVGHRLVERERLVAALERTGWVLAKAARSLGITPRQIGYAVQKHGIVIRKY